MACRPRPRRADRDRPRDRRGARRHGPCLRGPGADQPPRRVGRRAGALDRRRALGRPAAAQPARGPVAALRPARVGPAQPRGGQRRLRRRHPVHGRQPCRSPGSPNRPARTSSRQLTDAILRGVFEGDLAVALQRAAAFCRVVAAGRAERAAHHGRPGPRGRRRSDPPSGLDARRPRRTSRRARGCGWRANCSERVLSGRRRASAAAVIHRLAVQGTSIRLAGVTVRRASGRGSPGSQLKPLRAATRREALPARRTTSSGVPMRRLERHATSPAGAQVPGGVRAGQRAANGDRGRRQPHTRHTPWLKDPRSSATPSRSPAALGGASPVQMPCGPS